MLNPSTNTRELAYVVLIDAIEPIQGSDNCECANIGGWKVMVHKNEFQVGDPAIYFEIDSFLDSTNPAFSFMEKKKYKVQTQKYTFGGKGNFISQGLLMSAKNFGWNICGTGNGQNPNVKNGIIEPDGTVHLINNESRFLTKLLNVTYAETADNKRKAPTVDKYKAMSQRHPKLFAKKPIRWLMRREWGRKLMFFFFGKKRDKKSSWPQWVVKTDEERIENRPYLLKDKSIKWIATEKIDGTSTTFTLKRGRWPHKDEFYVCSRNVVFDKPDKSCFYDTNVYLEMAEKYHILEHMTYMLHNVFKDCDWITIQGETYGANIQKRDYHMTNHEFRAFNFITSTGGRWNSKKMQTLLEKGHYNIPCVPILEESYILPDTIEELRTYVDSETSMIDGSMREGIVFRSQDGSQSFKCVSPQYLLTYHQ